MKYVNVDLNASLLFSKGELLSRLEFGDCTVSEVSNLLEARYGAAMVCRPGNISDCFLVPVYEGILMLPFEYWEGIEMVQTNKARLMDADGCRLLLEAVKNRTDTIIAGIHDLAGKYGIDS